MINLLEIHHEGHEFTIQPADSIFASRKGCLTCDEWIEPVLFRNDQQNKKSWARFYVEAMEQNGTGVHYKTDEVKP